MKKKNGFWGEVWGTMKKVWDNLGKLSLIVAGILSIILAVDYIFGIKWYYSLFGIICFIILAFLIVMIVIIIKRGIEKKEIVEENKKLKGEIKELRKKKK